MIIRSPHGGVPTAWPVYCSFTCGAHHQQSDALTLTYNNLGPYRVFLSTSYQISYLKLRIQEVRVILTASRHAFLVRPPASNSIHLCTLFVKWIFLCASRSGATNTLDPFPQTAAYVQDQCLRCTSTSVYDYIVGTLLTTQNATNIILRNKARNTGRSADLFRCVSFLVPNYILWEPTIILHILTDSW